MQKSKPTTMQNNPDESVKMSFWDHVEVFRKGFFRCLIVWAVVSVAAFLFKEPLFEVLFAPSKSDFVLYRWLCQLATLASLPSLCPEVFEAQFINTQLASQFMIHLSTAMYVGVVVAAPYIVYRLYRFVSPALYDHERRYSFVLIFCSEILFSAGVLLNYFLIFPLSFRFLSTYQVQTEVVNQIALLSYTSTLLLLSLLMGIVFEIPILAFFLAKLGIVDRQMLQKYRKHAFVIICILAAIITPTADIFTLLLVACPIALLYEVSVAIVGRVRKKID